MDELLHADEPLQVVGHEEVAVEVEVEGEAVSAAGPLLGPAQDAVEQLDDLVRVCLEAKVSHVVLAGGIPPGSCDPEVFCSVLTCGQTCGDDEGCQAECASACVTNAMTFVGIRAAFAFSAACRKAPLSAMYIHRQFEPCRSVLKFRRLGR